MTPWRFYVYALTDIAGVVAYVGKGSSNRLAAQRRNYRLAGHELARFRAEKDAYAFECRFIEELSPYLNKHPGGNGSRATRLPRYQPDAFDKEINEVGSRRWTARYLLSLGCNHPALSTVALDRPRLEAVAYGPRC